MSLNATAYRLISSLIDAGPELCACKLGECKGCFVHSRVVVPADDMPKLKAQLNEGALQVERGSGASLIPAIHACMTINCQSCHS